MSTPSTFAAGLDIRVLVPPFGRWHTPFTGLSSSIPNDVICSLSPHPSEVAVIVRPSAPALASWGADLAIATESYSFFPSGDGTATLAPCPCLNRKTLYFPGELYGDSSPWVPENVGFWRIERVAPTGVGYLRRVGHGGVGSPQSVSNAQPSDIQLAVGVDGAVVLMAGVCSGVFPVTAITSRWMAVQLPIDVPAMNDVVFERLLVAQHWTQQVAISVDRLASVSLNDEEASLTLVPRQPGVETEMARSTFDVFLTSMTVTNLSPWPMKLIASVQRGK